MNSSRPDSGIPSDLWVSCPKLKSQALLRLFCFPYAGAGSSTFNAWSNILLPEVELCLIHLPGRDKRLREPLHLELSTLVERLTESLYGWLDRPFAFFGHSMGALISFEVARQLRSRFVVLPAHLFLSSCFPPQSRDSHDHLYQLPEKEFLQETEKLYGALPQVVKENADMLQLFLSILRADATMLGTYRYVDERPLDCPISLFGGLQDPAVAQHVLEGWRDQTTSSFELTMLPGDHFFIQSSRTALLEILNRELSRLLQK